MMRHLERSDEITDRDDANSQSTGDPPSDFESPSPDVQDVTSAPRAPYAPRMVQSPSEPDGNEGGDVDNRRHWLAGDPEDPEWDL